MANKGPRVGIVMGSDSDWPIMEAAGKTCDLFSVAWEARVLSAHRTPEAATEYVRNAAGRGLRVLIGGAGGAAHLPGVMAAHTLLPVIGVPIPSGHLQGLDSLLAIVQMPRGIPVATVGIGRADNAGLLAVHILALQEPALAEQLAAYREEMSGRVAEADRRIQSSP